ncbi:hypothetical protein CH63R_03961 [Colletotrichum higginsianum IMI 349063]|uniref:Uncharacterized protein n=1 Tax=Colletotrichum higginsianum (strain IMI 349063) TaxID=759273 RepID=A0A1B7YI29_COLHI|nr:hypothetical protein CH63R_03961 [Colletotrichum higginsianum IMI 349063]OBR11665.1 hypothetical protein CH63R_03961 [Colletotrichum higginsianum IMI 349063]
MVEVGDVDQDAARWWAAVLSTETGTTGTLNGWRASIRNDKGALLCSPWSIAVSCNTPFVVVSAEQQPTPSCATARTTSTRMTKTTMTTTTTTTPSLYTPAPYRMAIRYLSEYCRLHAISRQSEAALAAALMIPIAKLDGARIELPSPKPRRDGAPAAAAAAAAAASSQDGQAYLPWDEEVGEKEHSQPPDRLLTLSCHPRGAKALLSSIFFQPDIDCNLCGAWLQGFFASLDSEAAQEPQLRLWTFVRRDPGLAFLWLGAFITGAEARCVQDARSGWWKTDLSSAAWTGTHVSFIQGTVTKPPPAAAADISRADECRLMYLAHGPTHAVPPLFPFAPFGRTALQDADLDVRQHTQCPALHRLVYAGFVWDCQGGGQNVKQGAGGDGDADDAALIRVKTSELSRVAEVDDTIAVDYSGLDREDGDEISEMVTRNIFCWLRGDDGYPVAERALRQHEWINDVDSDDDDDDDGPGQGREDSRSLFGDTRLSR